MNKYNVESTKDFAQMSKSPSPAAGQLEDHMTWNSFPRRRSEPGRGNSQDSECFTFYDFRHELVIKNGVDLYKHIRIH